MKLNNNEVNNINMFEQIFDESTDAIFVGNEMGEFIKVNNAAASLTGYQCEELLKMNISSLFSKKVMDENPLKYDDIFAGKTVESKRKLTKKDGSHVFVEMRSKMLSNGRLISFMTDQTPQVLLKSTEQKYFEIIDNIKESLVILQDGLLKFANSHTATLLGYSLEDILNQPFLDFVFPEDRKLILYNYNNRLKDETAAPKSYEFRLFSKNGEAIWAEANPSLIEYMGKPAIQAFIIDIHEKKISQIALKESEKKFRELVENMEEGIAIINLEGQLLYASPGLTKIVGYESDEVKMKNFFQFIFKDDLSYVQKRFQSLLNNDIAPSEFRVICKDGSVIWVRSSSKPIVENGKIVGVTSVVFDINSRKVVEYQLKKSEEQYRNLIDNSPIGILIYQNRKIVYINNALRKIGKFDSDFDFKNITVMDFVVDEYHKSIVDQVKYINSTKSKSKLIEAKLKTQNGEFVDILYLGQYIEYKGIPSVQVYVYDVTDFNKYKTDVEKLSQAVEQSSSIILITDYSGKVEYANPSCEKLTGLSVEKVINERGNIFETLQITKDFSLKINDSVTKGKEWSGEFPITVQGGQKRLLHVVVSPIEDNWGQITHFVSIAEDITLKKEIERNLQIAKDSAEKSNELKSNFLAQMSHEIRTPINAIVSFITLLKHDLYNNLDDDQKISFELIEKASRRIIRTIELLLNYSELSSHSYQPTYARVNVNFEIISKLALEFRRQAKIKKLKFDIKIETEDAYFYGDRYSLEQIISNLIDNAIKYTEEGFVEIKLRKNENDKLLLEIKDSGKGIAKNYMEDIFEPFSQEEEGYTRSFEGNGLGLALVKKYCEMNKIEVKVESVKNVGSIFTLIFH